MRGLVLATLVGLVACGGDDEGSNTRVDDVMALTGDAANGEAVFADNCALCHGADGTGGSGPDITGESEEAEVADIVLFGEGDMTGFDGLLTDQEIADVIAYVTQSL